MLLSLRTIALAALTALFVWMPSEVQAQFEGLPPSRLALENLDAFRPTGENWQVAGGVTAEREVQHALAPTVGSGVLVNQPTEDHHAHLLTQWEHGDLSLELDVMMPKGSNAGIYLQGRYEIQLLDSWGVERPTFADMGGVYQRWDPARPEGQRGFQGVPPRMNVARAPGLWQHLEIQFRAPRFDDQGNKIANARFDRVVLNGVVIHEQVEVTGPTRAAAFSDEQPTGPLMIQGDHGPVAIRNVEFKRFGLHHLAFNDVTYRVYEGNFAAGLHPDSMTLVDEGATAGISSRRADAEDDVALSFDGTIDVPIDGPYRFGLRLDWIVGDPHFASQTIGGGEFTIDGREVIRHDGEAASASGDVELEAGQYDFELTYFKNRPGRHGMALYAEGPGVRMRELTEPESLPEEAAVAPIRVRPNQRPVVLRGFQYHRGEKRTHVVAVGSATGTHYSFDARQGTLLNVWKGAFLDATRMWHSRGHEQTMAPRGSKISFAGAPTVARLSDRSQPWPDSLAVGSAYRFRAYALGEAGYPTFEYEVDGVEIADRIRPVDGGRSLRRTLRFGEAPSGAELWCRVAAADQIERQSDGSYLIGAGAFYIEVSESAGVTPRVRSTNQGQELLFAVDATHPSPTLSYAILW